MRYDLILAPDAVRGLRALSARQRAEVREALERHLRFEPTRTSRSRIKRLRGLRQPQYRLRVNEIRVFYDVTESTVKSSPSSRSPKRRSGSTTRVLPTTVALAKVKDDLSKYLRLAASGEIVITRHGRPAGVIIGFQSDEDWLDYRLEHDPVFLARIEASRAALARGEGVAIEDVDGVGLTSKWSRRPSAGSRRPAGVRARKKA